MNLKENKMKQKKQIDESIIVRKLKFAAGNNRNYISISFKQHNAF